MNLNVQLIDVIQDEIIFDGIANVENCKNGLKIEMKNQSTITWKVYAKGIVIEIASDYKILLPLKENSCSKGHIDTEFGTMELKCDTNLYRIDENFIEVKYSLNPDDDSNSFHFKLVGKEDISWQALMFN